MLGFDNGVEVVVGKNTRRHGFKLSSMIFMKKIGVIR